MDGPRFDELLRVLAKSRRAFLSGMLATAVGRLGLANVEAKKKSKRKKRKDKKPRPNAYSCLEVGVPCRSEADCCSGICEGKTCRAHDTGTCSQEGVGLCSVGNPATITCNNEQYCFCLHTTAGSNICADLRTGSRSDCADCQKDADCLALGFPPGSACTPFSAGICAGSCKTGMICAVPCGTPLPVG